MGGYTGLPLLSGMASGEDEQRQQQMKLAMLAAAQQQVPQSQSAPAQPPPAAAADSSTPPMSPALQSAMSTPAPQVNLGHADFAAQPAAKDVASAQTALDSYQHRPLWKQMLAPALIGTATALGAHSWGGKQLAENGQQEIQKYTEMGQQHYQSLVQQLQTARAQQQSQYEADQRNRQQDILMQGNNQARTLMAQMAAGSRLGVAQTNAGSREAVANTNVGGREAVANTQGQTARDVAGIKGGFDIKRAQIDAQAALNRFLAGQQYADRRQQSGFAHTDNKPTADEDRRADLAQAASGYADMLIDIAQRRPELFGPLAGRGTELRQKIGSDDPDVAALKLLHEQLGITQMGAHSLRSAQAIGPIADSLMNSLHNDATATIATANTAKKGLDQFMAIPARPTIGGQGPTPTPAPLPSARQPLAKKVSTPARPQGVPANASWNPTGNGGKGSWQIAR